MKDTLERAKLESELHNIQNLVDRIPAATLEQVRREQKGKAYTKDNQL